MIVIKFIWKGVTAYDENFMVGYCYFNCSMASWTIIRYRRWHYSCINNYCSHLNHLQPDNRQEKIIDKNAALRFKRCVFIIYYSRNSFIAAWFAAQSSSRTEPAPSYLGVV